MNWVNDDDDNVSPPPPQANDGLSQMLATIRKSEINSLLNNNIISQRNNNRIHNTAFATNTGYTGNSAPGRMQDLRRSRNSLTVPDEVVHPYHQATTVQRSQQRQHQRQSAGNSASATNQRRNQSFDLSRGEGYQQQLQTSFRDSNNIDNTSQRHPMNPLLRMMEERMAAQQQQQQQQQQQSANTDSNRNRQESVQVLNTTTATSTATQQQHQPSPPMTNQEKVRQISKWNATKHPQQITRFNGFGESSRSIVSVSSCGSGSTARGSRSSSRGGRSSSSSSRGKKRSPTAIYYEQHQLQRRRRQTNSIRTDGEGAMRHSFNSSSPRGLDRTSVSLSEVDRLRIANSSQHHQQQYNLTTTATNAASAFGSGTNPYQSTSQEDLNKLQAEALARLQKRNLDFESKDSLQSLGSRTLSMASSNSSTNKMASRTSDVSM